MTAHIKDITAALCSALDEAPAVGGGVEMMFYDPEQVEDGVLRVRVATAAHGRVLGAFWVTVEDADAAPVVPPTVPKVGA